MEKGRRKLVYELDLLEDGRFKIDTNGLTIESQYVAEKGKKHEFMTPAQIFFASFMA